VKSSQPFPLKGLLPRLLFEFTSQPLLPCLATIVPALSGLSHRKTQLPEHFLVAKGVSVKIHDGFTMIAHSSNLEYVRSDLLPFLNQQGLLVF
jgi:hypothetical protein